MIVGYARVSTSGQSLDAQQVRRNIPTKTLPEKRTQVFFGSVTGQVPEQQHGRVLFLFAGEDVHGRFSTASAVAQFWVRLSATQSFAILTFLAYMQSR